MPQKNIFISHIHEDDAELPRMKRLLEQHGLRVRDGSINSEKPNRAKSEAYIKQKILAPRINWASTLVVLINHGTANSDYVNWEIEYAARQGKNIVGVYAHGATGADLPEALDRYGDATIVGWRGRNLMDAIEGTDNAWQAPERPDGRTPVWNVVRYDCG